QGIFWAFHIPLSLLIHLCERRLKNSHWHGRQNLLSDRQAVATTVTGFRFQFVSKAVDLNRGREVPANGFGFPPSQQVAKRRERLLRRCAGRRTLGYQRMVGRVAQREFRAVLVSLPDQRRNPGKEHQVLGTTN